MVSIFDPIVEAKFICETFNFRCNKFHVLLNEKILRMQKAIAVVAENL
jgi:hypothetical protein